MSAPPPLFHDAVVGLFELLAQHIDFHRLVEIGKRAQFKAGGTVGIVSVASHLVGNQIQDMTTAAREKEYEEARVIHDRLMPLFESLFVEPNPMPLKGALSELWRPVGDPRLPLIPARPDTVAGVLPALEAAEAA